MFDFITRRRLIFFLVAFLFVTITILLFAHLHSTIIRRVVPLYDSSSSSSNISIDKEQQISTCYLSEPVQVLLLCQKCTSYERRSKANGCSPNGYREYLECKKSNIKTYRSCSIPAHIQKQHFLLFEGFIFFLGLLSLASVHSRQKALDKQMVEKIKRQIGENQE
jgi:hypothetical protein